MIRPAIALALIVVGLCLAVGTIAKPEPKPVIDWAALAAIEPCGNCGVDLEENGR